VACYVIMEIKNAAGKILLHFLFGLSDLLKRKPEFVVTIYFLARLLLICCKNLLNLLQLIFIISNLQYFLSFIAFKIFPACYHGFYMRKRGVTRGCHINMNNDKLKYGKHE